jgi:hypothetical protein
MNRVASETRSPDTIISETFSTPDAKQMALDGVAIGKTNANEHAIVTGIIRDRGLLSVSWA